jgi:TIR domain
MLLKLVKPEDWEHEINRNIESADMVLVLVSADFLDSDYCYHKEMKRALERHNAGLTIVLPVLLRSCDWLNSPLSTLQVLPRNGQPITAWDDPEAAFADVAQEIRNVASKLRTERQAPPPPLRLKRPHEQGANKAQLQNEIWLNTKTTRAPIDLDAERHALLFSVRMSVCYHYRRHWFFDSVHSWERLLALLFGAVAFTSIISGLSPMFAVASAGIVTVVSSLNLVFVYPQRSVLHRDLMTRFRKIEEVLLTSEVSEAMLNNLHLRKLQIESDEPPILHTLAAMCYNEVLRSMGYRQEFQIPIAGYQRLLAHFFDMPVHIQ